MTQTAAHNRDSARSRWNERVRACGLAAIAGIIVPVLFALVTRVWGANTLGWPCFRSLVVFMYPFATVPARVSLYPLFALSMALNACYYSMVALIAIFLRGRMVAGFVVALVVFLVAVVVGTVLHVAFADFGAIHVR
jgi:hypothetical protein